MKRRHFLQHTMAGMAASTLLPRNILANPAFHPFYQQLQESDKILIIIDLVGGNDGLNTVVPLKQYGILSQLRSHVILPENKLIGIPDSTEGIALHPSLKEIKALYDKGMVNIIQNVGYDDQNFSHFRSRDIWRTGAQSNEVLDTGIMGRYMATQHQDFPKEYPNEDFPDPLALETNSENSLLFVGPNAPMAYVINNIKEFHESLNNEFISENPDTPAGMRHDFIRLISRQSNSYGKRMVEMAKTVPDNRQNYQRDRLGNQMAIISRLIQSGIRTPLYRAAMGGFDTHDNQVLADDHTTGEHADLLQSFSHAVGAFMQEMEANDLEDRVLIMTVSEFGRRIVSNSSLGTDHGAAAPLFIIGKHANGGIMGTSPTVDAAMTWEDNIELEYDFKQVYSSILKEWFCLDNNTASNVMGYDFDLLGLTKNAPCSQEPTAVAQQQYSSQTFFTLNNNLSRESIYLSASRATSKVQITLYDSNGGIHGKKRLRYLGSNYELSVRDLQPGQYFLKVSDANKQETLKFIKY